MNLNKGFTLIELVTVIVVLAILAAVSVPKFIDIKGDAQEATFKNFEGQIYSAIEIFHSKAIVENVHNEAVAEVVVGGKAYPIKFGYPDVPLADSGNDDGIYCKDGTFQEWNCNNNGGNDGYILDINDSFLVERSGIMLKFKYVDARHKNNCYVSYMPANQPGAKPAISITDHNCA